MAVDKDAKPSSESPEPPPSEGRQSSTPPDANVALKCALNGNVERFIKCFEDEEDPFRETIGELINERDEEGKTPLDMACILDRIGMVKELIIRGSEVNSATDKGYTSLHHAAAWGKINCLKILVENKADLQLKTSNNERAREIALRYNQTECVDFLDWAEAKQTLIDTVQNMRDTLADPEKVQGRLDRNDKNLINGTCSEKEQWVENTPEATTQDFIAMKQEFDETMAPIWQKLNEPLPEKEVKK